MWVEPTRWCYWVSISGRSALQLWERIPCFKYFKKTKLIPYMMYIVLLSEIAIWMYLYFLYCLKTSYVYAKLPSSLHLAKIPFPMQFPFPLRPLCPHSVISIAWIGLGLFAMILGFSLRFTFSFCKKWGSEWTIVICVHSLNLFDIHHLFCIQGWNEFSLLRWAVKIMYFCLFESLKETKQMLFCPVCLLKVHHVAKPLWAVGLAKTTACSREKTVSNANSPQHLQKELVGQLSQLLRFLVT